MHASAPLLVMDYVGPVVGAVVFVANHSSHVDTPILQRLMPPVMQEAIAKQTPIGRLGRPEEQAATICFLASDEASFITGQTLSPNGGFVTVS